MSTINPDTILTTQPPAVAPTTSGVRGVFAAIKALFVIAAAEITALQAAGSLRWLLVDSSSEIGDGSAVEIAYDQSVTIPADTLAAGRLLRIRAHGVCVSNPGFELLQIRIRFGGLVGVVLADTGVGWSPNDGDGWILEADLTIRSTTEGFNFGGFPTQPWAIFDVHGTKVIDTTSDADLVVTAEWLGAHAGQGSQIDVLEVFVDEAGTQVS